MRLSHSERKDPIICHRRKMEEMSHHGGVTALCGCSRGKLSVVDSGVSYFFSLVRACPMIAGSGKKAFWLPGAA